MATGSAKKPLYRKVNTRALGVHHRAGGEYRHTRNTRDAEPVGASMHGTQRRGRDYTPLFRFLLSKVGEPRNGVFQEAAARLDSAEPIWWLVARAEHERRDAVRVGQATYFSGLFIGADGTLQRVAPDLTGEDMTPGCSCCTHTLDGVRFE